MDCTRDPYRGLYEPHQLRRLFYGPHVVREKLVSCLRDDTGKAFVITGSSLATKTPLVKLVEEILTSSRHAGTFSGIRQHASVAPLLEALDLVQGDETVNTIITIGGGSPIDSGKSIIYHANQKSSRWLDHIAIPTTLSAAECTDIAGTTQADGLKTGIRHAQIYPSTILYDPTFALHTPPRLFLSTGIRALDHAVELQVNPNASLMPCQSMGLFAIKEFFNLLPQYKQSPTNQDVITRLFLAAYASLGFFGENMRGSVGLSHTLGYSIGSPYGIPHGITSCITLAKVVRLKGRSNSEDAARFAAILSYLGHQSSGDVVQDSDRVADEIAKLVRELDLETTLTEWRVGRDQLEVIYNRAAGPWMPQENALERSQDFLAALKDLIVRLY
jgi:alcohol dehydrogenase class IV